MKTKEEIQRAHDMIHAMVFDEIDIGQTVEQKEHASVVLIALCWILDCESGNGAQLEANLRAIAEAATAAGYRRVDLGRPMTEQEWNERN